MTGHCQLNLVTSLHPMLILFLFVDVKSNYSLQPVHASRLSVRASHVAQTHMH